MCGRYTLRKTPQEVGSIFGVARPIGRSTTGNPRPGDPDRGRFNIAPTQDVVGITAGPDGPTATWFRWGLVPPGAKGLQVGAKMINARSETVFKRSAFARPILEQRCLIPADGFIEWMKVGRSKHPFLFQRRDGGVFAMAGIWQVWRGPDDREVRTCAIVTTRANGVVAPLHDRMPVILHDADHATWLDQDVRTPAALEALLVPYPDDALSSGPVNPRVNDVRHDDPECLVTVAPPPPPAEQLGFTFGS